MKVGRGARLAFMLHAPANVPETVLFESLRTRRQDLAKLARSFDAGLRMGTLHPFGLSSEDSSSEVRVVEPVEAAVEFSVSEDRLAELCAHARQMGELLNNIADAQRSIVVVGPMHHVIEPQPGDLFLTTTFRREPGTTIEEMRDWWLNQHAEVACRFMLPEMLAYDQVHVEHDLSEQASIDAGFGYREYDSYDNLTWAGIEEFHRGVSKPGSDKTIFADEVGHLDHTSYVGALMDVLPID
jgi:hypothetical protein